MLNCRNITRNASDYLERHLVWRQRLAIRLHLMMCRHCSRFVSQLHSTVLCLHHLSPDELPAANAEAIATAARQCARRRDP
ncbi:MAG: zf-HC2 domain-containing protein [Pseudohongiellaceae bacterium]